MADCPLCKFGGRKIFEDEHVIAAASPNPSVPGHVIVFPKQHIQIIEQASADLASQVFLAANILSTALFEGISAQGTNIILMNGNAAGQRFSHLSVDIIPRAKDDGLNFVWSSRNLSEEQLSIVESELKDQVFRVEMSDGSEQDVQGASIIQDDAAHDPQQPPAQLENQESGSNSPERRKKPPVDYMYKQLGRMP